MLSKKVKVSTVVLTLSLLVAGCSNSGSSTESDSSSATLQSPAYIEGFDGNTGVAPATINNFGGPENYCQGAVAFHPDYSSSEQADYIQGCLDVIGADSAGSSSDTADDSAGVVSEEPAMTVSQENAVATAQDYLDYGAFSRSGLIEQLEFEEFSRADSTFAVDYLNPDWNEQAAKAAQEYLDYSSFSRQGLIDQLIFEGYTQQQAEYGVNQTGL